MQKPPSTSVTARNSKIEYHPYRSNGARLCAGRSFGWHGKSAAEQVIRTAKVCFDLLSPKTDSLESLPESVVLRIFNPKLLY